MLASAAKGIFDVNYTTADLLFLFAFVGLLIVGIVSLVQKATFQGVAWIALGLIAFGLMFITP